MKLAIASGKGGTGKTTIAINLALAVSENEKVTLLDCDVEEPNCHLFLPLADLDGKPVYSLCPEIDNSKCSSCGLCAKACQFNAIAVVGTGAMIFPELCHSCGGCALVCNTGAISEKERAIGTVGTWGFGRFAFASGKINVAEVMSSPVIYAVKKKASGDRLNIIDCPPGTSCPMVAAVRDADFALLVTEPTPFGLHDLKLAIETVRKIGIPCGVVINRAIREDQRVQEFCRGQNIPILLEIPDSRKVAEAYSKGDGIFAVFPELKNKMLDMVNAIRASTRE